MAKSKTYSFINIFGLSFGLAGSFFILIYVLNNTGYDRFHDKRNRIYRVLYRFDDTESTIATTSIKLAPTFSDNFPEIENIARTHQLKRVSVKVGNEFIEEKYFQCTDPEIFDIFTLKFKMGDPESALQDPYSIVLTEKMSSKYFGDGNPMGEVITIRCREDLINLTVTGVIEDIPQKSTFKADFFSTIFQAREELKRFDEYYSSVEEEWWYTRYITYLTLHTEFQANRLMSKFPEFEKKYLPYNLHLHFDLQPINEIYFHSNDIEFDTAPHGNIKNVQLFSAIGVLVLLGACINYIILSTSRSVLRSKEIGIRKVVGASINSLIKQVLGESIVISCFALITAIILVHVFLPLVNQMIKDKITIDYVGNWQYCLGILIITLFVAIVSGTYVAFFLSRYQPIYIIRSRLNTGITRLYFQRFLIVFQLVVFCILLICSGIIYKQIKYAMNLDMGFNPENLIKIYGQADKFYQNFDVFVKEISKNTNIVNVTAVSTPSPPAKELEYQPVYINHDSTKKVMVDALITYDNFIETFEIQLLEGRTLSHGFSDNINNNVLINETAVHTLEIDEPIGYKIDYGNEYTATVVGVVKDFHVSTVHNKIRPLLISLNPDWVNECIVRIIPTDILETISFLRKEWERFDPDTPFSYKFMNDIIEELYGKERRFGQIIAAFTLLTIMISSLGLFGLTLFITEQKKKEVGIRKIFGASAKTITTFIIKDFLFLVIISNLIAWPVAWYFMNIWLQNFAYRPPFGVWIFILTFILSLLIVLLTMSLQTLKTANTDPTEVLKYE